MWRNSKPDKSLKRKRNDDLALLLSLDRFKKPELPKLHNPKKRKHSSIIETTTMASSQSQQLRSSLSQRSQPSSNSSSSRSAITTTSIIRPISRSSSSNSNSSLFSWMAPSADPNNNAKLEPAPLPHGIETNPNVTKQYSVQNLMEILCGSVPIPEEDMFTGGPFRARYYEEQCLKNTKENSIYQNLPGIKKNAVTPTATSTYSRRQLLADFDEASNFSINVSQDLCSGSGIGSGTGGNPLQDISNMARTSTSTPKKRRVRFFLGTPVQMEDEEGEEEYGFVDDSLLQNSTKRTYFKDLDCCALPPTPVNNWTQENDAFSQDDFGPLF